MPDLNIPLLRKTIEHIEAHPDQWDQFFWAKRGACGTTMCFAGTATWLAGHDFRWRHSPDDRVLRTVATTDGRQVADVAQEELGLDDVQARAIFFCLADTPAELRARVEETIGTRL